jgi:hypothetical protein
MIITRAVAASSQAVDPVSIAIYFHHTMDSLDSGLDAQPVLTDVAHRLDIQPDNDLLAGT